MVCSVVPDRRLFEKIRDAAFGQLSQKYCAVCRLHAGNIFTGAFAASFGRTTDGLTYYASVPFHYNALFAYLAAVGLFGAFAVLKVKRRAFCGYGAVLEPCSIRGLSDSSTDGYCTALVSWVNALTGRLGEFWNIVPGETGVTAGRMLLVLLVQSVIVFVICIGIERLRLWVFDRIGKKLRQVCCKVGKRFFGGKRERERKSKTIGNNFVSGDTVLYPLLKITQGIELTDTCYGLVNYRFFPHAGQEWTVATYLANVLGAFLMRLPFGDSLVGMRFYTGLFVSAMALLAYFFPERQNAVLDGVSG